MMNKSRDQEIAKLDQKLEHARNWRDRLYLAGTVLTTALLLMGAASPGLPKYFADALQRIRPGVGKWAMRVILDANTTTTSVKARASGGGASIPACFPSDGTIVVVALNEATCCVSPIFDMAIGDQTTVAATTLDDPDSTADGNDGPGNCRTLPANGEWHQTTDVLSQRRIAGNRPGVCSAYVDAPNSVGEFLVKPWCNQNTDCTAAGAPAGTTCNLTPTADEIAESCLFVACRAANTSTDVTVSYEK